MKKLSILIAVVALLTIGITQAFAQSDAKDSIVVNQRVLSQVINNEISIAQYQDYV